MARLKQIFYKNIEILFIFILLLISHLNLFLNNCNLYKNLNFDSQSLFMWEYSAWKGLLPYKDVFYPYGLFPYFVSTNYILQVFYYLFFLIILLTFFYILRKLFQKRLIVYFLFFFFVVFINRFIGAEIFIRYGSPIAILSIFILFLDYKSHSINWKKLLIFSFISGILFNLFNDSGIYLLLSIIFVILTFPLIYGNFKHLTKTTNIKKVFFHLIIVSLGFILGFVPMLYYLISKNILADFYYYLLHVSDFFYVSKIPFTPGLLSFENIFTIGALVVTIIFIIFKSAKMIPRKDSIFFLQICLVFLLLLIEQKNVMRSSDKLLTFFGLFLFFIIFSDIIPLFRKNIFKIYLLFLLLLSFLTFGKFFLVNAFYFQKVNLEAGSCINYNLENLSKDKDLVNLKNNLIKLKADNIFSYPADPIIYSLVNQIPPFYFSVYESSVDQIKIVDYITSRKINYVVVNTSITSIQDSVPDYIRVPMLTRFIFNNYYPVKKIGNFLILKKNNEDDILNYDSDNEFKSYLLNVELGYLPASEGNYKSSKLDEKNLVYSARDIKSLNKYLLEEKVYSNKKILVFIPEETYLKNSISIVTQDLKKTNISLTGCSQGKTCIVNLGNLPLFYRNRILKEIGIANFKGKVSIYNNSDAIFW